MFIRRYILKTVKGNKTQLCKLKRVGGWCKSMFIVVCIAHPGVVCPIM